MATNNDGNFGTGTSGQLLTSNGEGVSPTFQTVSAGGGLPSIPKWVNIGTSLWWSPTPYTGYGNLAVESNTIYAMPFLTQGAFTLTDVAITCGTFSFASSIAFALYSSASGGTATLINTLGSVSVTGIGLKTITGLSQNVPAGWNYLCFQSNNSFNKYKYASNVQTICGVNYTFTGETIGQVLYKKGSSGFPATINSSTFGSDISTDSFIMLMKGY
jgi:hypothetical protein